MQPNQLDSNSAAPAADWRAELLGWSKPIGIGLIVCVTLLVYLPSISGRLIWDDEILTNNEMIKAPDGLIRFWFTTEPPDYWPMTNSSFWLEWRLWGIHPTGYHVTNLLLHIAAALLIWAILRKLAIPGAFLAALLFAVHPVNVESVAWIAQRKNTLAMFFFLLSIWWYLRDDERTTTKQEKKRTGEKKKQTAVGVSRWYWLSLLAFLLAMLSKGSVAILPAVLLGMAWWQRKRIAGADWVRTAPFFLIAAALVYVNIWFQTHGSADVIRSATFGQRLAGAGAVVWFYLSKALLPIHLIFIYPQWQVETGNWLWWLPLAAAVAFTAVLWRQRNSPLAKWDRPLLLAWGFFCVTLLPVLGFTDVGFMHYSLVADHYQHIALLGPITLMAAGIVYERDRLTGMLRSTITGIAIVVVAILALLTWQQNKLYGNAETLYQVTLEQNPDCWLAHNNLGVKLADSGRLQEAIEHFEQVLRLKPDSVSQQLLAQAHYNLGNVLGKLGRADEAFGHYQQALQIKSDYPEVHNNWGITLAQAGRLPEAIEHYKEALRLRPDYAEVHNNLGGALASNGQTEEAIEQFQQAVRAEPNNADAQHNLGKALTAAGRTEEAGDYLEEAEKLKESGSQAQRKLANSLAQEGRLPEAIERYQEALLIQPNNAELHNDLGNALAKADRLPAAIDQYHQAIRIRPDYAQPHSNLAIALAATGHIQEAIEQFQEALRLKPDDAQAHQNLGKALMNAGQWQEAIQHFQQSLEKEPDHAEAHHNLGVALAKAGRQPEAVEQFEQALRLEPNSVKTYANLTTAYAQLNRPAEAIATAQKALEMARSAKQTQLAQQIDNWLQGYLAQQNSLKQNQSPPQPDAPRRTP